MSDLPESTQASSAAPRDAIGTSDRRRDDRTETTGRVALRCDGLVLAGRLRDLSSGGTCVEIEGDLEFEVELEALGEHGRLERRIAPVRLLRSQRLPGGRMVLALEFLTP